MDYDGDLLTRYPGPDATSLGTYHQFANDGTENARV